MSPSELLPLLGGGFLLGLTIAVPLGPINLEIIRRGVTRHPMAGLAVGLGATSLDTICILASGFGLAWLVENQTFALICYSFGGVLLAWMGTAAMWDGIKQWRARALPPPPEGTPPPPDVSFARGFLTGLGIHSANPMTYIFWTTVPLSFFDGKAPSRGVVLLTTGAVLTGCVMWNLVLVGLVAIGRKFVRPTYLASMSILGGAGLLLFGLAFLWKALAMFA